MSRKKEIITMKSQEEALTLEDGFQKFIRFKIATKRAAATIEYYNECYKYFLEFCDDQTPLEEITQDTIIEYLLYIEKNKPHLAEKTIETRLKAMKGIFSFLGKNGDMKKIEFPSIKVTEPIKETYSDEELDLLLKKPDLTKCKFSYYRDWVIICHILATGNRRNTIINIKIKDVNIAESEIALETVKNKKAYIIPISKKYSEILREYINIRGGEADDYLFPNAYNEQLTANAIENSIKKFNQSRGVARTSIHAFRHTFAKKWILNGGDVFRLQYMLGHSSLDMVKKYVAVLKQDVKIQFDDFNPLDNMSFKYKSKKSIKYTRLD